MNGRDILTLFEYNGWANRRIMDAARRVRTEQFVAATTNSYGSLRGTLVHLVEAEMAWRTLCQNGTMSGFHDLVEDDFPTPVALEQLWQEEQPRLRAYLAGLTDADLNGSIHYTTDEGDEQARVLWHCLVHVVNHGTQHRSEAAVLLTDYGCSPGELDFTVFLNEHLSAAN
ncbi:MAG: DinB family protein [Caldilineaceae bacterium]|nr:DinB family protein [Caldilineaceae bacterium]